MVTEYGPQLFSLDTNNYYEYKYVNGITWNEASKYLEEIVLLIQEIDF